MSDMRGELIAYRPSPNDVLFFETENNVPPDALVRIKAQIQEHLPEGVEVIVLAGIKVSVVHKRKRDGWRWWMVGPR